MKFLCSLQSQRKRDIPMHRYLENIQLFCNSLRSMDHSISETMQISTFLVGLSVDYEDIVATDIHMILLLQLVYFWMLKFDNNTTYFRLVQILQRSMFRRKMDQGLEFRLIILLCTYLQLKLLHQVIILLYMLLCHQMLFHLLRITLKIHLEEAAEETTTRTTQINFSVNFVGSLDIQQPDAGIDLINSLLGEHLNLNLKFLITMVQHILLSFIYLLKCNNIVVMIRCAIMLFLFNKCIINIPWL